MQYLLGTELSIPGLEGIKGKLDTPTILIGENLNNLTIKYGLTLDQLIKLNRITSRNEIVAGVKSHRSQKLIPKILMVFPHLNSMKQLLILQ